MSAASHAGGRWRAWDVFVSYKKADKERVGSLVAALEREGFEVWWDRHIPPGSTWPAIIEESLDASSAVVAVWTEASVSDVGGWVHIEARRGKNRDALVPVLADTVEPPLEFSSVQAADLTEWDGDSSCDGLDRLLARVRALVEADDRPTRTPAEVKHDVAEQRRARKRRRVRRVMAPVVTAFLWGALAAAMMIVRSPTTTLALDPLTVDGLRAQVGPQPVERGELPVQLLIVSGRESLESVRLNIPGDDDPVRLHSSVEHLALYGGGDGASLTIDAQEYPPGSSLELQRSGQDLRLTSPDLGRKSLRVTGSWQVSMGRGSAPVSVDFRDRGTVEVGSAQILYFDFQPAGREDRIVLVQRAAIADVEFSDFVVFDPRGEATPTIVDGVLTATGGVRERLGSESALGWDEFEGTLSQLWLEAGAIRARVVGERVSGLRLDGVDRMPSLFAALAPAWQYAVSAVLAVFGLIVFVWFGRLARSGW